MLFCTLARKEQMAKAIVWAKAIRYYHPDSILVLGMLEHSAPPDQLKYFNEAVFVSNRGVPANTTESGCAAKAEFIKNTLDTTRREMLVYLDPETRMYTPFEEIYELLQMHSIVAAPYNLEPFKDPAKEVERIQRGVFNTGFLGLKNTPEAKSFTHWWADAVHQTFYGPNVDTYADHRWLEVTLNIHGIHILKDPAYDLSAWNLMESSRKIIFDGKGIKIRNGRWLRSINYYSPNGILKHEVGKLEPEDKERMQELMLAYENEVRLSGGEPLSEAASEEIPVTKRKPFRKKVTKFRVRRKKSAVNKASKTKKNKRKSVQRKTFKGKAA